MATAATPLFRDPIFDGAADPTIVFNRGEKTWWIVYTNRRANVDCRGVAWAHGTDIGIASSLDFGASFTYRGTLKGLEFEKGRNTFWAPEIVHHDGTYHMYVSYVSGVPHDWSGGRSILHYVSDNLWDWEFQSRLALSSERVIDACVERMPSGIWRMWYKDETNGSYTYAADSNNLYSWEVVGPVITDCKHEGPNVFRACGYYWMLTDPWEGLAVYRSSDAENWQRQAGILRAGGSRPDDVGIGRHADVLTVDGHAYAFYFTHPGRARNEEPEETEDGSIPYRQRRSSLNVVELLVRDNVLTCDRDAPVELCLESRDNWG